MADGTTDYSIIDSTYFVVKVLSRSAQGTLYKVQSLSDPSLFYALKLIDIREKDPKTIRRIASFIKSEFSLLKSLNHKNIVKVFDFGFDQTLQSYYFTMEYLDGQSLYDFFKQPENETRFPEVVWQALSGLNFLHANKILHYDINPKNIIILPTAQGLMAKILDFGLADINQQNPKAKIKKSLLYISPELYTQSGEISERIDIYSLGVSLLHSISQEVKLDLDKINNTDFSVHDSKIFNHKYLLSKLGSDQIRRFLASMIEQNPKLRPANSEEALASLNTLFGTSYDLPKVANHDSFQKNSRFLIRNDIVNKTVNYFCNYRAAGKKQTIVISGEKGSGKSRIAEQLHFNFSCMFHKTLLLKNNTDKLFGVIISLINQVYLFYSPLLQTDMPEFYKLLAQINRNIRRSNHYQTLFSPIYKFLSECAELRSLTLIFDEYEKYDLYSQRFIQHLVQNSIGLKINIIILFGNTGLTKREEITLGSYKESGHAEFIELNPLNIEEIRYIRYFLLGRSETFPADFEEFLISNGGSNFYRLMLLFDSLVFNKVIKKQDGVYVLENTTRLLRVLKMNEKKLSQSIIKKLNHSETELLSLLALSRSPLKAEQIAETLNSTPQQTRQSIHALDKAGLIIGVKKELFQVEYRIQSADIPFQMLSIIEMPMLILIIQKMISHDLFLKQTVAVLKDLSAPCRYQTLTELFDIITEPNRLLFLCELIKKVRYAEYEHDLNFRSIIMIYELKAYQKFNNQSEIKKIIKQLDGLLPNLQNAVIKSQAINLQIDIFSSLTKFNKAATILLQNSDFLISGSAPDEFLRKYLVAFKNTSNAGSKKIASKMINDIDRIITGCDKVALQGYYVLLHATKILYRIIKFKPKYIFELETEIRRLQALSGCQMQLFDIYPTYFAICKAFEQPASKDWHMWLSQALAAAEEQKNDYYVARLSNFLSAYYFDIKDYRNALITIKKLVSNAKTTNHNELSFFIFNQCLAEEVMLTPVNKILELLSEGREVVLGGNLPHIYPTYAINTCATYIQCGDFNKALYQWQEAYRNYRFNTLKNRLNSLDLLIKTGLFLMNLTELNSKIETLFSRKFINKEELQNATNLINSQYMGYVEKTVYTDEHGVFETPTAHSINLPGLVLRMISETHKIPSPHQLALAFDNSFRHKTFFKVINPVVNYILSPDEELLSKILLLLKKTYQNGYEMDIYFNTVPLIEYLFVLKNTSRPAIMIVDFVREIQDHLLVRMNKDQKDFFKQLYEYKRAEKTLKRFEVLQLKNI